MLKSWVCDYCVSPSPFGPDFGTLDFGTSDSGLTIMRMKGEEATEEYYIF